MSVSIETEDRVSGIYNRTSFSLAMRILHPYNIPDERDGWSGDDYGLIESDQVRKANDELPFSVEIWMTREAAKYPEVEWKRPKIVYGPYEFAHVFDEVRDLIRSAALRGQGLEYSY